MDSTPCTYRLSIKAIIKDESEKILLLRDTDGCWELPGGGLEHGETPHVGLAREIAEETGFVVESISSEPIAFWTINKEVWSPTLKWFAFITYEVKVSGKFRPQPGSDEAKAAQYFGMRKVSPQMRLCRNFR